MTNRHASIASARCGEATATATEISPIARRPSRCTMSTVEIGKRALASPSMSPISLTAIAAYASYSRNRTRRPTLTLRTVPRKSATAPSPSPRTAEVIAATSIAPSWRRTTSASAHRRKEGDLVHAFEPALPGRVRAVAGDHRAHRHLAKARVPRGQALPQGPHVVVGPGLDDLFAETRKVPERGEPEHADRQS